MHIRILYTSIDLFKIAAWHTRRNVETIISWIVIVEIHFFLFGFNYFISTPVEADYVINLNSSPPMEDPEQNVNHLVEDPGKLNHNIY